MARSICVCSHDLGERRFAGSWKPVKRAEIAFSGASNSRLCGSEDVVHASAGD